MRTPPQPPEQENRISGIIDSDEDLRRFKQHLKEIIEGAAFRGSQRSAQFLTYVVEQSIAGQWGALKERTIGIELFGRAPTYDTGEDAIVRVTASDVRKRLLQHYGRYGGASEFRVSLPPGHYVPEIIREPRPVAAEPVMENISAAEIPRTNTEIPVAVAATAVAGTARALPWQPFVAFAALLCTINVIAWLLIFPSRTQSSAEPVAVLPWSIMLHNNRTTMLVTSDPNIAEIQGLAGEQVSTSNYANQIYIPPHNSLSPQTLQFADDILRGDKAANVDVVAVAKIAALAQRVGGRLNIRGARNLRLDDLDTENNFIFIGSPLTDPWTALFDSQLDFRFAYDKATRAEFIRNMHPRAGEAATYVPTAKGFATGSSYATVSYIGNPNHTGQVLILAGLNAEGTKATAELVTHLGNLSNALSRCNARPASQLQHFQLLLRLSTMAGSPMQWEVLACHALS